MGDPSNTSSDTSQPGASDPASAGASSVKPGMTESEIRAAGLAIDVPFESGESKPQRLKYADLGPDHKYDASAEQQSDTGAGVHDGPLKGSEQAPSQNASAAAPTGEVIPQDATGAQAASAGGVAASDTQDTTGGVT